MTQTLIQPQYQITEADKKRKKRIHEAWKAYDGDLLKPLEPMEGQPDDNVLTNRCKAVVRRGASFLFGKPIDITVEKGAPSEAQDLLDSVWGIKEARIPLLLRLAMNGAIAGSPFLRIVPNSGGSTFRLVEIDPAIVCLQTAPQDCQTVLLYCLEYAVEEQVGNGKPTSTYYREEIQRIDPLYQSDNQEDTLASSMDSISWQIQHWVRIGDKGDWTPAGEPILWPYPFPPIFHCQNMTKPNDAWGEPDITPDLIGLNNALNLNLSSSQRSIKIYGHPFLWATGVGESSLDTKPGRVTVFPPGASLNAVAISSDLANALTFSDDLRSDMDELTGVPGIATGRLKDMPRGNVSGIALELLFMPLLNKTEEKRCTYGKLIIDVSKALLVLAGMSGNINITITWLSPLPHDDLASLQAAVLKPQIGISNTTIQRELGYDPDEEADLATTEATRKVTAYAKGQGLPPPAPSAPGQMPGQTEIPQGQPGQGETT